MGEGIPWIFLSHITSEAELAQLLKETIETAFGGMVEIFVSSNSRNLPPGTRWLDAITEALHECCAMLILASPEAVERPWVNFEAGAGWIRKIPVIPLCHSGMRLNGLPKPLDSLQAVSLTDPSGLQQVIERLSKRVHANRVPKVDFSDFIGRVRAHEMQDDRRNRARLDELEAENAALKAQLGESIDVDLEYPIWWKGAVPDGVPDHLTWAEMFRAVARGLDQGAHSFYIGHELARVIREKAGTALDSELEILEDWLSYVINLFAGQGVVVQETRPTFGALAGGVRTQTGTASVWVLTKRGRAYWAHILGRSEA